MQNEDLIVWMRTAALPTFSKLYRRLDRSTDGYRSGLTAGTYKLRVEYSKSHDFFLLCQLKIRLHNFTFFFRLSGSFFFWKKACHNFNNFSPRQQKSLSRHWLHCCRMHCAFAWHRVPRHSHQIWKKVMS